MRRDAGQDDCGIAVEREASGRAEVGVVFRRRARRMRAARDSGQEQLRRRRSALASVDVDAAGVEQPLVEVHGLAVRQLQLSVEHDQGSRQPVMRGVLEADADGRDRVGEREPVVDRVLALALQVEHGAVEREALLVHADWLAGVWER